MADSPITRRSFLWGVGRCAGACAVTMGAGYYFYGLKPEGASVRTATLDFRQADQNGSQMAIARGSDPARNTRAVIQALGGIGRFIHKGESVYIKPNMSWRSPPHLAGNTNPEVVAALVELCYDAGASRVLVSDNTCSKAESAYTLSGIPDAARKAGAQVPYMTADDFVKVRIPGTVIRAWELYRPLLEVDRVISCHVVKHHILSDATLGMKGWYGVIGGERGLLHQDINGSIVELAEFIRPTLTVLDATRVMMSNGPSGGRASDVKRMDTVAAGLDPVALDAWGSTLLDLAPADVGFITLAQERGLGILDFKSLNPIEVSSST